MFMLTAFEQSVLHDQSDESVSCPGLTCLWMFNTGVALGAHAAYNAIGYALLAGNSLMTSQLTINMAVQSGLIGVSVLAPFGLCISLCRGGRVSESEINTTLACGPCSNVLDAVIVSLIGAQIQGLFASNVTTPAYIAAGAATGAATVVGGAVAAVIIVGGTAYFCAELHNGEITLIPTSCCPNFTAKDLVRPCEVGLSICSREQMLALINSCAQCCPKPAATPAPASAEMTRQEPEILVQAVPVPVPAHEVPYAEEVNTSVPMAVLEQSSNITSAPAPSAPSEETLEAKKLTLS